MTSGVRSSKRAPPARSCSTRWLGRAPTGPGSALSTPRAFAACSPSSWKRMASPAPKPAADHPAEPATDSGLPLKPVYRAADAGAEAPPPGEYPFTRGIYPQMYRRRPWTIRQYAGFGSAAQTNRRFRYLLERGPTGLPVATVLFAYCKDRLPNWNTISISGYHLREAGATAVQELGFTMAHAVAYVDAARAAGLAVADFAPRISFFFAVFSDFFEEVAKFRAARRLWARLIKERYGVNDPRAQTLRFHTQTGGSTLTAQQPHNNIVRVALQAMSAVLDGM